MILFVRSEIVSFELKVKNCKLVYIFSGVYIIPSLRGKREENEIKQSVCVNIKLK